MYSKNNYIIDMLQADVCQEHQCKVTSNFFLENLAKKECQ